MLLGQNSARIHFLKVLGLLASLCPVQSYAQTSSTFAAPKITPTPAANAPRRPPPNPTLVRTSPPKTHLLPPKKKSDHPWKYDVTLSWTNAIAGATTLESAANPDNALKIPDLQGISLVRYSLKLSHQDLLFVVRPQFLYNPAQVTTHEAVTSTWDTTDFHFNDAFAQWTISDNLVLAYGLQNYQWGPAEAFSPSNTIFHQTIQSKDVLFEYRGHDLLRLNYTPTQDWSFVLISEVTGNGESAFLYGQKFEPQVILKSEHSWSSGADYLGLILDYQKSPGFGFGEYGNLSLDNGLSLYLDMNHVYGSSAWNPVAIGGGTSGANLVDFQQSYFNNSTLFTQAVAGARYAFTNGSDLRVEYIYDQGAYTVDQEQLLQTALTSINPAQLALNLQNVAKIRAPGLEFLGQHFGYVSLRVPQIFEFKDLDFYGRYMHSLTDHSGAAYTSLQYALGRSAEILAAVGFSHGEPISELGGLVSWSWLTGLRYSW